VQLKVTEPVVDALDAANVTSRDDEERVSRAEVHPLPEQLEYLRIAPAGAALRFHHYPMRGDMAWLTGESNCQSIQFQDLVISVRALNEPRRQVVTRQ
jgi:hypothetical protein